MSKHEKRQNPSGDSVEPGASGDAWNGRKLAEWVSLMISALLILLLAGFLVREALRPQSKYVVVEVIPLLSLVERRGAQYFLPIQVVNRGRQALRSLIIEVHYLDRGQPAKREINVDYLGEHSRQTIFLFFAQDPRGLQVQAEPLWYRLD